MAIRFLLTILLLAACEPVVLGAGLLATDKALNPEDPNFAAQNYAVADFLIQQAETFIGPNDLLVAEPLTDIQSPEFATTIASLIPEQIGVRISQLGYRVDLSKVTTTPDTNYLRPTLKSGAKPDFILTGTYLRNRRTLDVKTRIVDLQQDRIVAVFDYSMEVSGDLRDLSTPKPKILRVTE